MTTQQPSDADECSVRGFSPEKNVSQEAAAPYLGLNVNGAERYRPREESCPELRALRERYLGGRS
jgi:hypothetical protein